MQAKTVVETEQVVEPVQAEAATPKKEPVTLVEIVVEQLRALPVEKQLEVRDFVEFLAHRELPTGPRESLFGIWADLGIDITEEDIREARREMWGNFPREDI